MYSHYFTQHRPVAYPEWAKIRKDFETLFAGGLLPPIQYESDEPKDPQIDADRIRFNGVGDDGYETMLLAREKPGLAWCKTSRKDYDAAVVALLILAYHHAPGAWDICSDGDELDWQEGLALARRVRPDINLPIEE